MNCSQLEYRVVESHAARETEHHQNGPDPETVDEVKH